MNIVILDQESEAGIIVGTLLDVKSLADLNIRLSNALMTHFDTESILYHTFPKKLDSFYNEKVSCECADGSVFEVTLNNTFLF